MTHGIGHALDFVDMVQARTRGSLTTTYPRYPRCSYNPCYVGSCVFLSAVISRTIYA